MSARPCSRCGLVKPDAAYYWRKIGYRFSECRACISAKRKAFYAANAERLRAERRGRYDAKARDRRRNDHLRYNYGIDLAREAELLEAQGGRCAICRTDTPGGNGNRFHVDHDHATGAIRGLLCHRCNAGLGSFNDDPDEVLAAWVYLAYARIRADQEA